MTMPFPIPPFVPPKPNQTRVDVDPDKQRRFLQQNGLRLLWERAALCPCGVRGTALLATGALRSDLLASNTPGDAQTHDPDCPTCFGEGVIYYASQEIRALALGMQINYQPQGMIGDYAPGYAAITTFPEHQPNYRDRFTVLDTQILYQDVKIRTAETVEALRFPIAARTLRLTSGDVSAKTLYAIKTGLDWRVPSSGAVLQEGVDFTVTPAGLISWALGDGLGTAPLEGARYSISYFSNPRFVVVDPGFPRSSRTIKKQATDTPKQLAIRSIARALWLGEGVA
jgi:hypothetical protein